MRYITAAIIIFYLTACGGGKNSVAPIGSYSTSSHSSIYSSKRNTSRLPSVYKVKKGDTLYSISWRYGMNYKALARINNIRAPYNIYVGQKLRFKSNKKLSKTTTNKSITSSTTTQRSASKATARNNKILSWRWPANGKVVSTYAKSATGRNGIAIQGKRNQAIFAAAAGKVVYSGNGLPRYGNLLIIKHNDAYLSAYAHNNKLLFKDGDYVKAGQKIATMGSTGTQNIKLYFEIRKNGKPVDPLLFLPKR